MATTNIENFSDDYKKMIETLRSTQANTMLLNESDENKKDDESDLNALLKDNSGAEDNTSSDSDNENLDDLNFDDLGKDDKSKDDKESEDDLGDLGTEEPKEDENKFETDSEGLMDTITRLTKAGHTVKIVVSAEGNQYQFNDKKVSGKQLKALAEMLLPPVKGNKKSKDKNYAALSEELNNLKKQFNTFMKTGNISSIKKDKIIKMKDSDYAALTEMCEDMAAKIEEQNIIIKNYESLNSFNTLDEAYTKELNEMTEKFSESMDEINNAQLNSAVQNATINSYAKGTDTVLNVINESIFPLLTSSLDTKAKILAEMDIDRKVLSATKYMASKYNSLTENKSYQPQEKVITEDIQTSINKLNNVTQSITNINKFEKLNSLMESKLKYKKSFTGNEVMRMLNEASDLVAFDNNPDYDGSIPKCESFEERVAKTINSALAGRNKSDISVLPDNEGNLLNRNEIEKFDLPIARDNFNPNTTVKSAIMQLAESLTDIDGKLDIDLCKKAYLYQKVKNPTTMKDFAIPIATINESDGKLYAHPKLIEFAANMLASDKSMRTYGITSRRELEMLRESLMPYLKELEIEAPWTVDPNDNFSKTNKENEKKKNK